MSQTNAKQKSGLLPDRLLSGPAFYTLFTLIAVRANDLKKAERAVFGLGDCGPSACFPFLRVILWALCACVLALYAWRFAAGRIGKKQPMLWCFLGMHAALIAVTLFFHGASGYWLHWTCGLCLMLMIDMGLQCERESLLESVSLAFLIWLALNVPARLLWPGGLNAHQAELVWYIEPVENAEALGTQVTTDADSRVTPIGRFLRKYRLDELPQVFNVLGGSMSFVGTRPEVPRYVEQYKDEYYATLLLPYRVTSLPGKAYVLDRDINLLSGTLRGTEVTSIEANSPVLVTAAGNYGATGVGVAVVTPGSVYSNGELTGTYTAGSTVPDGSYVLQVHGNEVAFYLVNGYSPAFSPFRAYIRQQPSASNVFRPVFDGDATGLREVDGTADGHALFNLSGQRVAVPTRGIYVIDGKKVVIHP